MEVKEKIGIDYYNCQYILNCVLFFILTFFLFYLIEHYVSQKIVVWELIG